MVFNPLLALMQSMRIPFLLLTPVCVLLGWAVAVNHTAAPVHSNLLAVLTGALAAHISVNTFNEYFDFKSGLDLKTQKTPFSGGSGALVKCPEAANLVLSAAVMSLLITIFIGLYLVFKCGFELFWIGLAGILIIVSYTQWLNKMPVICLIAPGLGFGLLMVLGTQFCLIEAITFAGLWASLIAFFLINNLLLLNQLPDIRADKRFGRRHFSIAYGINASLNVYGLFILFCILIIVFATGSGLFPLISIYALLPLCIGLLVFYLLKTFHKRSSQSCYPPLFLLALNLVITLMTPLILAISLFIS